MIIKIIAHSGRHMTAEEVYTEIAQKAPAVNLATVYRTLDLLVANGLASCTDMTCGKRVYATARHGPHAHLVCRRCGKVLQTGPHLLDELMERIRREYGFTCGPRHFRLPGLCADCSEKEGTSR
ncbi:transcriptional repressor [Candidatus Fermentibacteria bacterium]|nr:transcriptional repressor [Candidatus Fermentibacteria bacterium]